MSVTILVGDAIMQLRARPSDSVHMCVSSPPYYGKRDYGVPPSVWGGDEACAHRWGEELLDRSKRSPGTQGGSLTGDGRYQAKACRFEIRSNFCVDCGAWRGALGLEPHPDLYVEHLVMVFEEVRRVLRPDGTLWLNLGDSYATGPGRVGEHPGGGAQGRAWMGSESRGYRGERLANGRQDETAVLRKDVAHAGIHKERMGPITQPNRMKLPGLKPKDLIGIPWMAAFALRRAGWWLRGDNVWDKPAPMPESVNDRCTVSHEYMFLLAKSERYFWDAEAIAEPANYAPGCGWEEEAKGTRGGKRGVPQERAIDPEQSFRAIRPTRNKRTVWRVASSPFKEAHFATFPPKLVEPCVLAGTSERGCCVTCSAPWERVEAVAGSETLGWWPSCHCESLQRLTAYPKKPREDLDRWRRECAAVDEHRRAMCDAERGRRTTPAIVLDPFGGAGTTGMVADRLQRDAIIIELNPEYAAIASGRLEQDAGMFARAAE